MCRMYVKFMPRLTTEEEWLVFDVLVLDEVRNYQYSRTQFTRINCDGEPPGYADNLDN